jgi:hypothetical protein
MTRPLLRLLPLAAALALALPAAAQDKPTEIKLAHWVPANHLLAQTGFIPWGQSIEKASGGSIKVTIYPAQQLGKAPDHYDMARDGIATVSYVNPGYQPGRFPIIAAGELPFLVDKPGPASKALDAWYRQYAEKEMKDVKVCMTHLHVGTLHSKAPITDPAQIKGMKIRPANGTVSQMVNTLGGTAVQVSAPEGRRTSLCDAGSGPWIMRGPRISSSARMSAAPRWALSGWVRSDRLLPGGLPRSAWKCSRGTGRPGRRRVCVWSRWTSCCGAVIS